MIIFIQDRVIFYLFSVDTKIKCGLYNFWLHQGYLHGRDITKPKMAMWLNPWPFYIVACIKGSGLWSCSCSHHLNFFDMLLSLAAAAESMTSMINAVSKIFFPLVGKFDVLEKKVLVQPDVYFSMCNFFFKKRMNSIRKKNKKLKLWESILCFSIGILNNNENFRLGHQKHIS